MSGGGVPAGAVRRSEPERQRWTGLVRRGSLRIRSHQRDAAQGLPTRVSRGCSSLPRRVPVSSSSHRRKMR